MLRALRILPNVAGAVSVVPGLLRFYDVEHVRGLEAELKHRPSGETDIAKHAQIDVSIAGAVDDAAAGAAVGSESREGECRHVEPRFDQFIPRSPVIELRIADEIGAIVGEAVEIAILIGADGQRRPRLQRHNGRERPVAREPTGH